MKKFLFCAVIFMATSLSTINSYATCGGSSNMGYCTVTSNTSSPVSDGTQYYITPFTDVYFSSFVQSLGNPGAGAVFAYTDWPSPIPWDLGTGVLEWVDQVYDSYGVSSSKSGVHWQTHAGGWIDLHATATLGYAYVAATW